MTLVEHRPDSGGVSHARVARTAENGHGPSGIGEALDISRKIAGVTLSLTRRFTLDIAHQSAIVGKEIIDGVLRRRSPSEIATTVVHGWAEGARTMLGVDQDIERLGTQVNRIAKPMTAAMPSQVRAVAESVTSMAPLRAALGLTGLTVQEVRWNLKVQGMELLKRSTALDDPDEHPALSRILLSMCPDEARIVRFLATGGPQAVIDVRASNPMTRKNRDLVHNYSLVGRESGCIRPQYTAMYLDNLARLGVASIKEYRLRSQRNYDLLTCQPEVAEMKKPVGKLVRLKVIHKGVELSEFGKELYRYCLETPGHPICPVPDRL